MIRKILIISFFVIAFIALTGCSSPGALKSVTPATLDATNNIEEPDGEVEVIEPVNELSQEESLPNGGYQDQDNINVDHQFEGIE
jgi:PBP1b-binding outer membrane lipoprotein LpoB